MWRAVRLGLVIARLKETGLWFPRSAEVCKRYDMQESRKYVADEKCFCHTLHYHNLHPFVATFP